MTFTASSSRSTLWRYANELVSYVKMCPNFKNDSDKWTCASGNAEEKVLSQYNLLSKMDTIREEHLHYISKLARYNNEVITC